MFKMKFNFKFSNLLGTVYRNGNLVFSPDGNEGFLTTTLMSDDARSVATRDGGPLTDREPGDAEHGQGGLDHDAGPAIEGPAHQTRHLQHRSLHGDTADAGPQGHNPGPSKALSEVEDPNNNFF